LKQSERADLRDLIDYLLDGWDQFIAATFPGLYPEDELFNLVKC